MKLGNVVLVICLLAAVSVAQDHSPFLSLKADRDPALDTNPASAFWTAAPPTFAELDVLGRPMPEYRTEVRSRWTRDNLYFLFVCPYKHLFLKPAPNVVQETNELWNWNVAEVFIGSDFQDIKRYKEFEVSPQNEWVDLDINLHVPVHEDGWVWNSGFEHATRVDEAAHTWYVVMRIPFAALGTPAPSEGTEFRLNLFRTEGPPKDTKEITWRAPMSNEFHVPERFGLLKLVAH